VTAAVNVGRDVSIAELQRAWRAVHTGQFRYEPRGDSASKAHLVAGRKTWAPGNGEQVLPVVGCAGVFGASTTALALASIAGCPARIVECCSATSSGLAAASTAELGVHPSGWRHGTRGQVLIERVSGPLATLDEVPVPSVPDRPIGLTVLDVGWDLGHVLGVRSWLGEQVKTAGTVVVVSCATIPGLRHLEGALSMLGQIPAVAAVVGSRLGRWPKAVRQCSGPLTRALDSSGSLIGIPHDSRLAVVGLDSTPLPPRLLDAAQAVLELTGSARKQALKC
jgi:hypothetical protein